jgi:uncharacterized protein YcbK (DUF882 family)
MSAWIVPPTKLVTPLFHDRSECACNHCGKVPSLAVVQETAEWLEEVRHLVFGDRPMGCNSWCRCRVHNKAVGGAPNSLHMQGLAVDLVVKGLSPTQTWKLAKTHQGEGKLIGGCGRYASWVHLDRGPVRSWNGP